VVASSEARWYLRYPPPSITPRPHNRVSVESGKGQTTVMNDKQTDLNQKNNELKKENRRLQRELARKEKALAEAAVLLTLKKKFHNLFATEDEET